MVEKIFILGSTGFIGSELAKYFAGKGYSLILHGRNREKLVKVARSLNLQGSICLVSRSITSDLDIDDIIYQLSKCTDSINVVISALGMWDDSAPNRLDYSKWIESINSNLIAPVQTIIKLYDLLSYGGAVIVLSCLSGVRGYRIYKGLNPSIPYVASKAGVVAVTRQLAEYMASKNIRVITIAPSWIEKDTLDPGLYRNIIDTVPLKRPGKVVELAKFIDLLISSDIDYVSGAVIEFSGGL